MKNFSFIYMLTIAFLVLAHVCHAEDRKIITLKDGSVLKGKVLELKDEIYTIEVVHDADPIKIPESNILSITVSEEKKGLDLPQDQELRNKANKLQGKIMEDDALMLKMKSLGENPEVRALLSDPKLLSDVMSMDPKKIQGNKNVQELMNNPEMQKLMQQIQQKFPAQ